MNAKSKSFTTTWSTVSRNLRMSLRRWISFKSSTLKWTSCSMLLTAIHRRRCQFMVSPLTSLSPSSNWIGYEKLELNWTPMLGWANTIPSHLKCSTFAVCTMTGCSLGSIGRKRSSQKTRISTYSLTSKLKRSWALMSTQELSMTISRSRELQRKYAFCTINGSKNFTS